MKQVLKYLAWTFYAFNLEPCNFVMLKCFCSVPASTSLVVTVFLFSDKDWRKWADCLQASHQREPLEMGPSQCSAGVQKRKTRLHHCHPEASTVWLCCYMSLQTFSIHRQNAFIVGTLSQHSHFPVFRFCWTSFVIRSDYFHIIYSI